MKVMCLTEEEISDVFQVIAGVLQLGNVHFMAAGGAQVAEKSGMSLGEKGYESISYPESSGFLVSGATSGRLWGHQKNSIFLIGCSVMVSIVFDVP